MNEDKEMNLRYIFELYQNKVQEEMTIAATLKVTNFFKLTELFVTLRKEVIRAVYDLEQFDQPTVVAKVPDALFPTEKN